MEYVNDKLEEFNNYLVGRKVAIIGLGVSNLPLLDYLHANNAIVKIFDEKDIDNIPNEIMDKVTKYSMEFSLGKNCLSELKGFDLIFRSPSCLPTRAELVEEENRGAIVTTEIELLMKMCPCPVIGITGSDGKTTTTTLIYKILKNAGYNCFLGGNIGIPLFTKLNEMTPEDIVVLELSSFQLMGMQVSPQTSVITNITPNHLNIHKDYEEYIDSKKNIFRYQDKGGTLILNYDNVITRACESEANGNVIFFSSKEKLDNGYIVDEDIIKECDDKVRKHILDTKQLLIKGKHNYENICAAIAATKDLVPIEKAVQTIKEFTGVEHRIELVRTIDNVRWYNDSASSSPTRTLSALNAFDEEIILIAGGYDKKLDYEPLAKPIIDKVKALILIGQTSEKIFNAVKNELDLEHKYMDIYQCDTLEQTVQIANKIAKPNQVVIFSPASASFDMFKNFADRGNQFKNLVNNL